MAALSLFFKSAPAVRRLPAGSFTVDRYGNVLTKTVPTTFPPELLGEIAEEVLLLFREARTASLPLAEVSLLFADLDITARDMQGGAVVFLTPKKNFATAASPPTSL